MKENLLSFIDIHNKSSSESSCYIDSHPEYIESNSKLKDLKIEKVYFLTFKSSYQPVNIILNLLTLGIINLFYSWFPSFRVLIKYNLYDNLSEIIDNKEIKVLIVNKSKKKEVIPLKKEVFHKENLVFIHENEKIRRIIRKFPSFSKVISSCEDDFLLYFFEYKGSRYLYNKHQNCFGNYEYNSNSFIKDMSQTDILNEIANEGLNSKEKEVIHCVYGENKREISYKSLINLILDEIKNPFYLFQLFSIVVWIVDGYRIYALIITFMSLISISVGVRELNLNYNTLRSLLLIDDYVDTIGNDQSQSQTQSQGKAYTRLHYTQLLPGDLILLNSHSQVNIDGIIVEGKAVLNESSLTGESKPVFKEEILNINCKVYEKEDQKFFIYDGTKIINIEDKTENIVTSISKVEKSNKDENKEFVKVIILSTGFNTRKGELLREILYRQEEESSFSNDSMKYLYTMFILSIFGFGIDYFLVYYTFSLSVIIIKAFDLITITVPPALPICLNIGITISIKRLKVLGITCMNRMKMNMSGTISHIVLDKTGTLTDEKMKFIGYISLNNKENFINPTDNISTLTDDRKFNSFIEKFPNFTSENKNEVLLLEGMSTCHSLGLFNDHPIGHPIDEEMFKFTKSIIKKHNLSADNQSLNSYSVYFNQKHQFQIIKRFTFTSKNQRMSVIIRKNEALNQSSDQNFRVYCKGAPEKVYSLCKTESLPCNFNSILIKLTSKGYRILGICMKYLAYTSINDVITIKRDVIESDMTFLGFIIFHNPLKPATFSSIKSLRESKYNLVICTGDNLLTACSVAKECGMLDSYKQLCEVKVSDETDETGRLTIEVEMIEDLSRMSINTQPEMLDNESGYFNNDLLKRTENISEGYLNIQNTSIDDSNRITYANMNTTSRINKNSSSQMTLSTIQNHSFISQFKKNKVSSKSFHSSKSSLNEFTHQFKINFNPKLLLYLEEHINNGDLCISSYTLNILKSLNDDFAMKLLRIIYENCKIYGRMSPEDKADLLFNLNKITNNKTLMCGDGANDCMALQEATVGISISNEENNFSSSFSSGINNISCVLYLLIEGKSSITTTISLFRYMIFYSLLSFIYSVLYLTTGESYIDNHFIYIDIIQVLPFTFLLSNIKTNMKMQSKSPIFSSISEKDFLITNIFQYFLFIFSFFFISFITFSNEIRVERDFNKTDINHDDFIFISIIFIVYSSQMISLVWIISDMTPFKIEFYKEKTLFFYMIFLSIFTFFLIFLGDETFFFGFFELKGLSLSSRLIIFTGICFNFGVGFYWERRRKNEKI